MADLAGYNGERREFRIVGKPNIPGKLSHTLAAGVAKFGSDFVLPGMLHAKFLRSPYAHARVLSLNTEKAEALQGVACVITWEDPELCALKSHGESFGPPRAWLDNYADQEGAEVAAIVVAESEDICNAALKLLEIEWEILPHIIDLHEGRQPNAYVLRPEVRESPYFITPGRDGMRQGEKTGNTARSEHLAGDISEGFKMADHVVEFDMYLPAFASHMPAPPGSVAWWADDPYLGECLHVEGAVRERFAISQMYNYPLERTIQEGLFMGGKYCDWGLRRSQEITPLLAKRTGRPVRCVNTREETYDLTMQQRFMHLKVGYTNDGLITAVEDRSIADGGVWGSSSFGHVADQLQGPYNSMKCKNVFQYMEIIDTNRGKMYVSGQHCPFNWDSGTLAIYLIAEHLGLDPIDVARTNIHGPESQDDLSPQPSFEACVKAGIELMGWNHHKAGTKQLPDGRMHGASFRYQMCPRHALAEYQAKLELRNGVVHMPTQGPLFGVYAVECNAMVVAEELGLEYDDVSIDFDYREMFTPVGGGADGTTASAWVMKECVGVFKRNIIDAVVYDSENPMPQRPGAPAVPNIFEGYSADQIDIADGCVFVKSNPEIRLPLSKATRQNVFATYKGRPPMSAWNQGMGKKLDIMNAAFCEVAVDTETGVVEILRFGVVADPGKVMRPTSLESQIDQVMYFSQGCQLFEDYVYDKKTGVRLNTNMIEYKKPGILDVPPVERVFLETRAGNAAYGAGGISHSLANSHLAIIAIHNAIGVWVDPPATPDKVLNAISEVKK